MYNSTLIHIPHSSTCIPPEYRKTFCADKPEHEIEVMTDWFCDDLFSCGRERIVFPVSRLVCDPERFREDRQEVMAEVGMGAVYERCSDLSPLRKIDPSEKERILRRYYDPHHRHFSDAVRRKLEAFGECVMIDGHSFYPSALPYERCQRADRPDFCIGTSEYHTPEKTVCALREVLEGKGFSVGINVPFEGTIVPMEFFEQDRRVHSVMVEINRRLYMDTRGGKSRHYEYIRSVLRECISAIEKAR